MFDLSKGFDMSSIMSEQLRKNFVPAADITEKAFSDVKLEDFTFLLDLSKVSVFEVYECEHGHSFVVAHLDRIYIIKGCDLLDTPYAFILDEKGDH